MGSKRYYCRETDRSLSVVHGFRAAKPGKAKLEQSLSYQLVLTWAVSGARIRMQDSGGYMNDEEW